MKGQLKALARKATKELLPAVIVENRLQNHAVDRMWARMPRMKRRFVECLRIMARGSVTSFELDMTDPDANYADIEWYFPCRENPFAKPDAVDRLVAKYNRLFEEQATLAFIDSVMRGEITTMSLDGYDDGRRYLHVGWKPPAKK